MGGGGGISNIRGGVAGLSRERLKRLWKSFYSAFWEALICLFMLSSHGSRALEVLAFSGFNKAGSESNIFLCMGTWGLFHIQCM